MPKPSQEVETSLLDMPLTRSKFLSYFALLLSAVGLGSAQAHSTRPLEVDTSGAEKKLSPKVQFQKKAFRHTGKVSDRFPNSLLQTQDNKTVRFYDDLIKNKIVIIDFMWATCDDNCPMKTASLVKLHSLLEQRAEQDILMLSISLEGKRDTPESLRQYIKRYGASRSNWLYLTGDYDEIDAIRYSLGVYDLDPVIDADRESHAGIITFGNDRTNRWAALPALMNSKGLARTISRITQDSGPVS